MKNIKLKISEDLTNLLTKMEKDSKIAQLLLSEINPDLLVADYADYLDFSNQDETKVSYVNPQRIEKINEKELDIWSAYNYRYQSKPGALLSKIFNNKVINHKEVENFVNLFKSLLVEGNFQFSIIEGDDIKKWYYGGNYVDCSGSLGNSCMKYDNCQEYFNIYINNKIKMLILTDRDNRLVGRSLLWKANDVTTGCEINVLDRIYTINDDELAPIFKNWAKKNDYIYRQNQNWPSSLHWIENGQLVEKKLLVILTEFEHRRYPYLDTFKFLNKSTGALTNYIPDGFLDNQSSVILTSADGSYQNRDALVLDDITHYFLGRGEAVFLENENIYTSYENVNHSHILNRNILKTDCEYVEELGDYIFAVWDRNPENVKYQVTQARQKGQERREKSSYGEIKISSEMFSDVFDLVNDSPISIERLNVELGSNLYYNDSSFRFQINRYITDYISSSEPQVSWSETPSEVPNGLSNIESESETNLEPIE